MESRLKRLRTAMAEKDIDALLITNPTNRRYISGFTGSAGMVLVTHNGGSFITDFRYVEQAKKQSPHFDIIDHQGKVIGTLLKELQRLKVKGMGFEQTDVTYDTYLTFQDGLEGIHLVPTEGMVEKLRIIKDKNELDIIREAAKIVDDAFSQIIKEIKPGIREKDIALQLEILMRRNGASSSSFDIIVASGIRSALPHGVASEKIIEEGDMVTLDFGAKYKGYCSDMTRTVAIGNPSERLVEIYEIVKEAQRLGVQGIRSGLTGKEADELTRKYITDKGYGEYFGHGTGHGIGLDIHEEPRLSLTGETVLQPGMVVTVEPGIYIPGLGGVRIEDDVIITEEGSEIITHSSKDLIRLG
ncbi:Xaa-Pro peptidase family protein [Microaerobacter geothermalis]|uniref:M24 family metallopeptidase n=1 Tax=Microaerobacter geothermalis TaxID=674972 RepID=UPI001F352F50|nr:Xaa-Pro peptidase family protein [Microaerobacter geothermalis]MCF6094167.1 Xaa-Pro peptidase family protein [Microaerobacter geothermalis]